MHDKGYSATILLAMLNVHTTVTVLMNSTYCMQVPPSYEVLEYLRAMYTNTYLRGAAVLYAEKNVQVTCEPQHCMTTFLVQHPENCFFTLFTPFCTIPFSEHTIVSMIVIFVCAVECLFVVSQLVEKWRHNI